ncbi:MAG TPA: aspartate aminotransferase family protein [Candidatus Ornithocaccomicrobium faecavium]|uniref:Aspartate aminotransferase family protein n=1 Tax=Candidatus Ornithocaccomicrobium faecavium TaxID=2840890 RepID=A0A9D1TB07_9FIRM|nr:aspartate aminotransferase family protein [Candidatus Ornithocaccomicrobium faecavium]
MNVKAADQEYIANTYSRFDLQIVSGHGSLVYDDAGKEYIDLGSGIAANAFGVCDAYWQQAVIEQVMRVQHTSNLYYTEPQARLAKLLCEKTGMKKVFFSNSGAESNECAIKAARKYASDQGSGRDTIITLKQSFHGRTITTLSATGQEHFHHHFGPFTPGFVHVTPGDVEELRAAASGRVCAIMLEMVQGEGGVNLLDADYVHACAEICEKNDILLIVDEVQTGNGRTGKLYAYEHFGIHPDIVSTAKGLGGGLPIGATLLGEKVKNTLTAGTHGSTFGGNPVCAAGAYSILSRIDEALLSEVAKKGEYIFSQFPEATGLGLMVGIPTQKPAGEVVRAAIEKGVLCLTAKDKIRLLPALTIPWEQLKAGLAILKEAMA